MIMQRKCSCGRLLFKDDEALSLTHEEPECEAFLALVAAIPPDEVRKIQPGAMVAHFDALRRRVRNSKN